MNIVLFFGGYHIIFIYVYFCAIIQYIYNIYSYIYTHVLCLENIVNIC